MGDKISGENDYNSLIVLGGTLVVSLGSFLIYKFMQKGDEDTDSTENVKELEKLTSKEHAYVRISLFNLTSKDQRKKRNQKKKKNEIEVTKLAQNDSSLNEVKEIIKEQPKEKSMPQPGEKDHQPKTQDQNPQSTEQPKKNAETPENNTKNSKKNKKKKSPTQKIEEVKLEDKPNAVQNEEEEEEGEWVEVGKKNRDSQKYKNQQERIKQDYNNYLDQF